MNAASWVTTWLFVIAGELGMAGEETGRVEAFELLLLSGKSETPAVAKDEGAVDTYDCLDWFDCVEPFDALVALEAFESLDRSLSLVLCNESVGWLESLEPLCAEYTQRRGFAVCSQPKSANAEASTKMALLMMSLTSMYSSLIITLRG